MSASAPRIAVVGATGVVGQELLALLHERGHPAGRVTCLASPRSAGRRVAYGAAELGVRALDAASFDGLDFALFAAGADVAREAVPRALAAGALVVDNSSAFRADPEVPLVVPELLGAEERTHAFAGARCFANPNCSTILLLVALEPLRRAFGIEEVVVSTYQAVSGAGQAAIDELFAQTRAHLAGAEPEPRHFPEPCAFNVFAHESAVDPESGANVEEQKIVSEAARLWGAACPSILPTCVRVPVERSHSQSVVLRLARDASAEEVRRALDGAAGVRVLDERAAARFPTPLRAQGGDDVWVGRVRRFGGPRRFGLWLCGDQLRKGAALNAIQVMELALEGAAPA